MVSSENEFSVRGIKLPLGNAVGMKTTLSEHLLLLSSNEMGFRHSATNLPSKGKNPTFFFLQTITLSFQVI